MRKLLIILSLLVFIFSCSITAAVHAERLDDLAAHRPGAIPARLEGLVGVYGSGREVIIFEKEGRFFMMVGPEYVRALVEKSGDLFAVEGSVSDPPLRFSRRKDGRAQAFSSGKVLFPRRFFPSEGGAQFTIKPLEPVEALRERALKSSPPQESGSFREPELVEIPSLDGKIRKDIRYATAHNFMATPLYSTPKAYLQEEVTQALVRVSSRVNEYGFGLQILDAYRPWFVTKMFWDATPPALRKYVADPEKGSRHNRGASVDLTLYDLGSAKPVAMTSGYDEFSLRSAPDFAGGTSLQRWHRDMLRLAMEEEGFSVYPDEWWHFDHKSWKEYPLMNRPFEELDKAAGDGYCLPALCNYLMPSLERSAQIGGGL